MKHLQEKRPGRPEAVDAFTRRALDGVWASADQFFRQFDVGWAVYDSDLGEGIEGVFDTKELAEAHVEENFEEDQRDDVEVFACASAYALDDGEPVVRITEDQFHALAALRALWKADGGEARVSPALFDTTEAHS